jgi:peptidoglycan biosynthesis protein MviN/MurJ (putative lipid II flippase)
MCFTIVFGTLLTANRNLKQLNLIALTTLVITLILSPILVPIYGAKGTAITTLSAQLVSCALQWLAVRYTMKEKLENWAWLKLASLAAVLGGMLLLKPVFDPHAAYWVIALFSIWAIWTFSFKIIDLKAILSLLKKSEAS